MTEKKIFDVSLPILRYGRDVAASYHGFKQGMLVACQRKYGHLFRVIINFEYYLPPVIPVPDLADGKDPYGLAREEYKQLCRARRDIITKMETDRAGMFGTIWGQLSVESESAVKNYVIRKAIAAVQQEEGKEGEIKEAQPDTSKIWTRFLAEADPLELWRAISDTHLAHRSEVHEEDQYLSRVGYQRLHMLKTETVQVFKERVDQALAAMEAVGEERPKEETLANDFLFKLDDTRYARLKADLSNNQTSGIGARPKTLEAAYILAMSYKVVTESGKIMSAADPLVFTTTTSTTTGAASIKNTSKAAAVTTGAGSGGRGRGVHGRGGRGDHGRGHGGRGGRGRGRGRMDDLSGGDPNKCKKCGAVGHWARECTASSYSFMMLMMRTSRSKLSGILLDNQASISIFYDKELLSDIHDIEPTTVSGVGGAIMATQAGFFGPFKVLLHDEAPANVLSYAMVEEKYNIEVVDGTFIVTSPDGIEMRFVRENRMHIFHPPTSFTLVSTVEENENHYSRRELIAAKEARQLIQRLGYPDPESVIEVLKRGGMSDVRVSVEDVKRAYRIYGADVASLKGKSVFRAPIPVHPEQLTNLAPSKEDTILHADIMYLYGQPHLVGILQPFGLFIGKALRTKSSSELFETFKQFINEVKSRGHDMSIMSDGEGAVKAIKGDIEALGVKVNITGAGGHVPVIERGIRTIKDRVRSITSVLPFKITKRISTHLINFVISRLNLTPSKSSYVHGGFNLTPKEAFTGIKTNYKRDIRIGFGEYVQCVQPYTSPRNSMTARTTGAISLFPSGNAQGSVFFYCLATGRLISRDRWIVLPMPGEVIDALNKLDDEAPAIFGFRGAEVENELLEAAALPPAVTEDAPTVTDPDTPETAITTNNTTNEDEPIPEDAPPMATVPNITVPPVPTIPTASANEEAARSITAASPAETTRSTRTRSNIRPPERYRVMHISVDAALHKLGARASAAIVAEFENMKKYGVFTPVTHTKGIKPLYTSMFLKEKFKPDGSADKVKARLVVGGDAQDRSLYKTEDTTAPTVSTQGVFSILAIAAAERRHVASLDVPSAYLNAKMEGDVYIRLNSKVTPYMVQVDPSIKGYVRGDGSIVMKLQKALYGCIESARLWYLNLKTTLNQLGFISNEYDQCVFNSNVGKQVTIIVHVDDLIITSQDAESIDRVCTALQEAYGEMQINKSKKHSYLGMSLDFVDDTVVITMSNFIDDLLSSSNVEGTVVSPAANNLFQVREAELLNDEDKANFHSTVAKMLYLAKRCRPDLLTSVSFLTTRVQCPDTDDLAKLQRLIKYVRGSKDLPMVLGASSPIGIHAYVDSSFGIHSDTKGHTGGIISMGRGAILSKSTAQRIVTKSSTEAEMVGISDFLSTIMWSKMFLEQQGYGSPTTNIFHDSQSAIMMASNGKPSSDRTKHMNVRYFFIKEKLDNNEVVLVYKATEDMVADILTKPLQGAAFRKLRALLLGHTV